MVANDYRLVGIPFVYFFPDLIYILGAEIRISKNFAQIVFRIDSTQNPPNKAARIFLGEVFVINDFSAFGVFAQGASN